MVLEVVELGMSEFWGGESVLWDPFFSGCWVGIRALSL